MSEQGGPAITIITATFNAANELATTAASLRRQTYSPIQWIVVDGGSTDSTVDVIRSNADIVATWVSEPDRGIYDAWNKGCSYIEGEWVMFLGAGDELPEPDTLEQCAEHLRAAAGHHDIVYGMIDLVSAEGAVIARLGSSWQSLKGKWGGLLPMLPPHPSSFHHRSIFSGAQSFDARFRYAGDTEFTVRSVTRSDPLFIPIVVDRMLAGGVSVRPGNMLCVARERRTIARDARLHAPVMHVVGWHVGVAFQLAVHSLVPVRVRAAVRRLRNLGRGAVRVRKATAP